VERIKALLETVKALIGEAQARFQGLTPRERRLVLMTGSAAGVFVIFLILISFSASAAGYRRRTEEKLLKLRDAQTLAASYRESEQTRQQLERQLTNSKISLITYLEEKGTAAGLSIPAMTPKPDTPIGDGRIIESAVELTLQDVSINKLVEFLSNVERAPGVVKVKSLRIEPRVQQQTLTAWTTIATYRMKP